MRAAESYLSTQAREPGGRALAALVTLKGHNIDMVDVYRKGLTQFLRIARPAYRNYGLVEQDYLDMWRLLERWMLDDPSPFIRKYLGRSPLLVEKAWVN